MKLPGEPATADLPADWPHRAHSRWLTAGGLRWHVQLFGPPPGTAPAVLLLHGTGASTHSWRDFIPALQQHLPGVTLVAPDLPGHAYTGRPARDAELGLPGIAAALGALLGVIGTADAAQADDRGAQGRGGPASGAAPTLAACPAVPLRLAGLIGHSAGAAIAAQLWLDGHIPAEPVASGAAPGAAAASAHVRASARAGSRQPALVSLNGAWFPPAGFSRSFYSPMAKLLAGNRLVPPLFAWQASRPGALRRLVASTGSVLDATGEALYARLVTRTAHVSAVLAMMAQWNLSPLLRELPRLGAPPHPLRLHLVAAEADATVPPRQAVELLPRVPGARLHRLPGLGHLAHEEAPAAVAELAASLLRPALHR